MLQKIVFQDNIYQILRSIETVHEGLMLDLSKDFFFDKTVDDLLYFDVSIQKLYKHIQANDQLSGYVSVMHSLHSCQNRYLALINFILDEKSTMREEFCVLYPKLKSIRDLHYAIASEISKKIQKTDKNNDSHDIVSQNELSELLNF